MTEEKEEEEEGREEEGRLKPTNCRRTSISLSLGGLRKGGREGGREGGRKGWD
jgi:hypothetical protein